MNVLIDYHHTDLAESLHRLFERLGFTVHVPDGLDWFEQGIWRQGHELFGDAIARQFLLAPNVDDLNPSRVLNRVSLEEAKGMDWDVVVASVPDNEEGYAAFAKEHGARYCVQVGNVNQWVNHSLDPLILDATGKYPSGIPFTPEFDIDSEFQFRASTAWGDLTDSSLVQFDPRTVASFVNLFPGLPCYPLMQETQTSLPEWEFSVWGHNTPDGFIKPTSRIGALMRAHGFGWQDKVTGDGFGYVIHYWASVGRPLIGHASHYRGQTAADLWEDGVTAIDLDEHTPQEAAALMEQIVGDPDRHMEMCFEIARRVRERIDFTADAERVADALGLAVPA